MKIVFADQAWEDYLHWQRSDPKILKRLNALIRECCRTPHKGTGKPEPLKGDFKGWWSRRLTDKDRLVYRVEGTEARSPSGGRASTGRAGQRLEIAQCRFHY